MNDDLVRLAAERMCATMARQWLQREPTPADVGQFVERWADTMLPYARDAFAVFEEQR